MVVVLLLLILSFVVFVPTSAHPFFIILDKWFVQIHSNVNLLLQVRGEGRDILKKSFYDTSKVSSKNTCNLLWVDYYFRG